MVAWLFKDGESLPVESGARRMRMGMLAQALVERGHEVHWFSSTFLHLSKRVYSSHDEVVRLGPRYHLHLIHSGGFRRNFSVQRYLFYRRYAARLKAYCRTLPAPDLVICAFPLIDVAAWAVEYARQHRIPVTVDVRDLWPDAIVEAMPTALQGAARLLLTFDFQRTRYAFSHADSLCAMSEGVLHWALRHAGRPRRAADRVVPIGYPLLPPPDMKHPGIAGLLGPLNGRPLFVYAGTFGHTYRIETILEAARLLKRRAGSRAHFVLVGDGPLWAKAAADAASLDNVTMTGWLDQPALRSLLAQAAAGVLPWAGRPGAMPNKLFDYLAAGLPVLSSAEGELNDELQRRGAGNGFRADRPDELADLVMALSADPQRRERQAESASKWFAEAFSEQIVYQAFAGHLETLQGSTSTCASPF